ncbi:MAG: hypothetical protein ACUVWX_11305 [Kiritimatiellia bacterium]
MFRTCHYPYSSERTYLDWGRRYFNYLRETTATVGSWQIQELLGHRNVETPMIYTHVVKDLRGAPRSPLDSV